MARKKTSLRDFQQYLSERLKSAARGQVSSSLLGVRAGKENWLLELSEAGEIIQLPPLTPVPLTNAAFSGIANIRGNLYAVTDFSYFRTGEPTVQNAFTRLLLIGAKMGSNAALLVTRMQGLKNIKDFEPVSRPEDAPAWIEQPYRDQAGEIWNKLSVSALLNDERFMNIGA
ncbi:MAG: CheW-like domain protein [Betaproteobacteria bacterium ADurb.Bin341]|nr:MAG: CheW-like domain protein [Betaproteobacteria bacterium ADurb.Bin341]